MGSELTLGLWDGHDSGAALLQGRRILFAINEERLTRRKLEIQFPHQSIRRCLQEAGRTPSDVSQIVYSTTDFAKTLTRLFPALKEEYYHIRRRRTQPTRWTAFKKQVKYEMTRFMPSRGTRFLSDWKVRRELVQAGFTSFSLHCVNHHLAHAAGAFYSGFERALVLTLDGIGDGLSGTVSRLEGGVLQRMAEISGDHSFGLFYEHVTNLMNMRELEDEGKVMALANYAYPVEDAKNPMLDLIHIEGGTIRASCAPVEMYRRLRKILWNFPAEQFCYMAQRTLERRASELVRYWVGSTGLRRLVLSGGVASNVKMNRLLRNLPEIEDLYVFPHMGDGGLALGAASWIVSQQADSGSWDLQEMRLGPAFSGGEIDAALREFSFEVDKPSDIIGTAAQWLAKGEIVFWFQGRMELGPRALGGRSILALPGSRKLKDELNMKLKKRVWYQPFCPSMLEEEARNLLEDFAHGSPDRFMANAYLVNEERRESLCGVLNVDGTCRPQIIPDSEPGRFAQLLRAVKAKTGLGVLLNTSMNIHGEPLACSPRDALRALADSGGNLMVMEDYLVHKTTA